ncbi:hypothetical protein DYB28_009872 [Aphanomyces astaci]|uniref:Tim44-like domain-containing protein n=1 Tax=Aphanomyces astaci TaxID=112090 RepID=A0A9X8EDX8_APHAT|nr:hypothetical protein DYB28_009872 [Aphanomyces astaci]
MTSRMPSSNNFVMNGPCSRRGNMRAFSSNSSLENNPTTFQRAVDDKDRYFAWDDAEVFAPDMFVVKKMALFAMIHQAFPNKADFDLPEFLDGAKHALELVLRTVYSPAFLEAAVDPAVENDEINLLKEIMTPECLDMLTQGFKIHHDNGCTKFDLTQLDVRACHLANVKLADDNSSMLLYVQFDTAEHVTVSGTKDGAAIAESSVREAEATWVFESPTPSNLRWTVVQM